MRRPTAQPPISNCGTIIVQKHTDPRGVDQNFSYTSNISGGQLSRSLDATPAGFTLNDSAGTDPNPPAGSANTEVCTNVPVGNYTMTEGADPTGFAFGSLTCQATSGSSGPQDGTVPKQANISLIASKTGNGLNGATFSITKGGTPITGSPFTTATVGGVAGVICVDNLAFVDYVVTETAAPNGFAIDTQAGQTVTVDNNAKCSDNPYVGEAKAFTDTPLSNIQVNFKDDGSGETNGAGTTIVCDPAAGNGTDSTTPATGWDKSLTRTGIKTGSTDTVIHCTITIDP